MNQLISKLKTPRRLGGSRATQTAVFLDLARGLRDKGNLIQAIQVCQDALELEPRDVEANQLFYDLVAEQQGLPPRGEPWLETEVNSEAVSVEGTNRDQSPGLVVGPVLLNSSGRPAETEALSSLSRVANDRQTLPSKERDARQVGLDVRNVELVVQEVEQARTGPKHGPSPGVSARRIALLAASVLGLILLVSQIPMQREEPGETPSPAVRISVPSLKLPKEKSRTGLGPVAQSKKYSAQVPQQAPAPSVGVVENGKSEPVAPVRLEPASRQTPSLNPSPSKPTGDGMLEIYNLPPGVSLVLQGPGASTYDLKGSGSRHTWKRMDLPLGHYRLRVVGKAGPDCSAKEMRVVIEEGIYTKVDFQSRCRAARENNHGNR